MALLPGRPRHPGRQPISADASWGWASGLGGCEVLHEAWGLTVPFGTGQWIGVSDSPQGLSLLPISCPAEGLPLLSSPSH